ncbi:MAG: hypothetical protein K8F91_20730 [Candidatus Obscuribacterales bacterium]|nr:hypothetical protein [Candidatus Obscuribacterales bacterium]
MDDYVSKSCSDYLRERFQGLKASHARELVAAFFGYKSHAALLSDKAYPIEELSGAQILIPDEVMIYERKECLKDLPASIPSGMDLSYLLADFLQADQLFEGEVWHCDDIGEYMLEEYLPEHLSPQLDDELADVIESVNAFFEEIEYDEVHVDEKPNNFYITVKGTYSGVSLDDDNFNGDTIDFEVFIKLPRWAGKVAFSEPEIEVDGTVNCDYLNEEDEALAAS